MNRNPDSNNVLSTNAAAEILDGALGEGVPYWAQFLVNNRRNDRDPAYRIEFERFRGMAVYREEQLDRFIEWERGRQLGRIRIDAAAARALHAFGVGAATGGPAGRQWGGSVRTVTDPATGKKHLQLIINEPLLVYRLDYEQGRSLVRSLERAMSALNRSSHERHSARHP
jgi:hypothetical protein